MKKIITILLSLFIILSPIKSEPRYSESKKAFVIPEEDIEIFLLLYTINGYMFDLINKFGGEMYKNKEVLRENFNLFIKGQIESGELLLKFQDFIQKDNNIHSVTFNSYNAALSTFKSLLNYLEPILDDVNRMLEDN
jgi:hypothetical protein